MMERGSEVVTLFALVLGVVVGTVVSVGTLVLELEELDFREILYVFFNA